MKNTISRIRSIVLVIAAIVLSSCSAEDGQDGATGPQGIAGIDGTNGADGADGNSDMVASSWIEATYTGTTDSDRRSFDIPFPELTDELLNSGLILFYGRAGISEVWGIPAQFPFLGQNFSWYTRFSDLRSAIILCDSNNGNSGGGVGSPYLTSFRYIILPSNTTNKGNGLDFSKMPYEEVIDRLGLEY